MSGEPCLAAYLVSIIFFCIFSNELLHNIYTHCSSVRTVHKEAFP